ncbi:MAG TPA: hypothetical protein VIK86_08115 [Candidatus Paceibacterota bacterium]
MAEILVDDPSANVVRMIDTLVKNFEALIKNSNDLFKAEIKRIDDRNIAESDRINELRKGDIEAVRVANVQAVKTAELLNAQMLENAEVLRKSVEGTAVTIATQLSLITTQQDARFAKLEQAQWENQGKSVASPDLVALVTDLVNTQNVAKGRSSTFSPIIGMLYAIGGGIITFLILQFLTTGKL